MMQAQKDYGVEVVTAYEFRRVGQVFYPPAMLRDALIARGLVRALGPDSGKPETKQQADDGLFVEQRGMRSPVDRMIRPADKQNKRR